MWSTVLTIEFNDISEVSEIVTPSKVISDLSILSSIQETPWPQQSLDLELDQGHRALN